MKKQKEQNQTISKDILDRAMAADDRALWARIGAQARSQIRMKRLAAWGAGAAVLLLALSVVALIGLNEARAGRDGWLARIFMPVLESRIYGVPDPETGFCPIKVEDGTWQQIDDNTEAVLRPYLPMDLPDSYVFVSGSIKQPDRDTIDMALRYETDGRAFRILYTYRYGRSPDLDTETARRVEWDGADIYLWEGETNKAALREEEIYTVISVEGDIDMEEMEEVYRSIKKQYLDDMIKGLT